MKFLPNTLGAEPKKLAILGGLAVVLGGVYWMNQPDSGPPPGAQPAAAAAPVVPNVPAVPPRTSANTPGPRRTANSGARVVQDFRPSLKLPEGMDIGRIDPSLRLDLLAKLRSGESSSGARSLFEFGQAPAPPPPKVKPIVPEAPKPVDVEAAKPVTPPAAPKEPPPPPISLKFYGYAGTAQSGQKRAFFLDGDEIFVAGENDLVRGRYKIIRIGVNSAVVEDTVSKSQQTLQLVEELA